MSRMPTGSTEGLQLSSPPTPMCVASRCTCTLSSACISKSCFAAASASRLYLQHAAAGGAGSGQHAVVMLAVAGQCHTIELLISSRRMDHVRA